MIQVLKMDEIIIILVINILNIAYNSDSMLRTSEYPNKKMIDENGKKLFFLYVH